jgi:hypothetical protein
MRSVLSRVLLAGSLSCGVAAATAAPLLRCHVVQGDTVTDVQAVPTADPYRVAAVRVNHFRFKAVVVAGAAGQVDYVKLYTYYETGEDAGAGVRLLHEVRYLHPPPQRAAGGASLTGTVYLYEPRLGREFSYDCTLREAGA